MSKSGLHASVWAPKLNGDTHYDPRPGDWTCPSCGFSNFQWRTDCYRCSFSKGSNVQEKVYHSPEVVSSSTGYKIGTPSQDPRNDFVGHDDSPRRNAEEEFLKYRSEKGGLSTSRWAPRGYDGNPKKAGKAQVWTRTVTVDDALSKSRAGYLSSMPLNHPDLGLPYEVQHYILVMIQRIIEEGCFDFASRWIPNTLSNKNWVCSEAVEISTWKSFLPSALPDKALVQLPDYPLERALADAVRIRNSAVHRHLCDNIEVRRMALQAQDLMTMFSDVTRQNKFHRLWAELKDWDASRDDTPVKRNKLEAALREISERPLDDMDWTPNAVSLQEIKPGEGEVSDIEQQDVDEMELD